MMNTELDFIQTMFDSIAPKYDFLNRFLSLRQDVYWRKEMVKAANLPSACNVLDAACGTCDVSLEILKQKSDNVKVIAADFSPGMLILGRKKIQLKHADSFIRLTAANALKLPFKENTFQSVFIAFGIRNIMNRAAALDEFYRVIRPGGSLAILELTTPENRLFKFLYLIYFKKMLPILGSLFSKHAKAYHYLPESVLKFPASQQFARIMKQTGFKGVCWKPMTLGIVTLFIGKKS